MKTKSELIPSDGLEAPFFANIYIGKDGKTFPGAAWKDRESTALVVRFTDSKPNSRVRVTSLRSGA